MSFLRAAVFLIPFTLFPQAKKPVPPPPLEPPQPVLTWIYPSGGQRGKTVEIRLSGTGIAPDKVLITGGGVTAKPIDSKDANNARIAVTIEPDAALGERELRVMNAGGVSNRYRFQVGDLPEINEKEPNSEKSAPQQIDALPVVINGQITEGDRDYFRFHAKAGDSLVCAVQARALLPFIADAVPGWFDPVLVIYDSTGKQIQYADDFRFKPDPVLFFRPPADGDYTIELRDVIYRGRSDFVYRLTIGAVPFVTDIFPLGGRRDSDVALELRGVNLPSQKLDLHLAADAPRVMRLTANSLPFWPSDLPSVRATGAIHTLAQAQRVATPVAIDGRMVKPGDSDYYVFAAKQGEKLVLEVQARRLDSPLDSILTLFNSKQAVLAENDDWNDTLESMTTQQVDSHIVYTFPAAGDYFLRLRDVQGKGGPEFAYRLTIAPSKPDFTLRITPDNPRMGQGDTAAITVSAVRRDEFNGDIELSVEDLPPGYIASKGLIAAGQNEGRLTITAPADAPIGVLSPRVVGAATIGKDRVQHRAESAESMMQAFASIHILPTRQLFLAVTPPAGFTLSAGVPPDKVLDLRPESDTEVIIKVLRKNGVKGAVTLMPLRLANGVVTTKTVQVPADKDEATVTITVTKDAKPGLRQDLIISAVMRSGNSSVTRFAQAIPIRVSEQTTSTIK
ncbi:Peptidase domain protein [Candidatus Sulfopaludibacter sp. SbA3]|nr:Peptidase domain protein [Candidatus Sulfopaludibacter sp. SbA3]